LQVWIAEYIYDDAGTVKIRTSKVHAPDYDTAKEFALGDAPDAEFVMRLHPESEEQFLGRTVIQANEMTGRTISDLPDPDADLIDEDDIPLSSSPGKSDDQ
jgi:hypothetical protein